MMLPILMMEEEEERRCRHARDVVHLIQRNVLEIKIHSPQRLMRIVLVV
jgi:hypothetical protein